MSPEMVFAVSLFTFFSVLGLVASISLSFKPLTAFRLLSKSAGFDLEKTAVSSVETGRAMEFLLIDFTSQMAGLNLFALLITWIPFRQGENWAWLSLWFYPVMFAWHYWHYAKKTKFSRMQVVYCLLSIASLVMTW